MGIANSYSKNKTSYGVLYIYDFTNKYLNMSNYSMIALADLSNEPAGNKYIYYIDKNDINYTELMKKAQESYEKRVTVTWHKKGVLCSLIDKHKKSIITNIIVHSGEFTSTLTNIIELKENAYHIRKNKWDTQNNIVVEDYYELIFDKQKKECIFAIKKKKCDKLGIENGYNLTIRYESIYDNIYIIKEIQKN